MLLAVVAAVLGFRVASDTSTDSIRDTRDFSVSSALRSPYDFSELAQRVEPSVVNISTERDTDTGSVQNPFGSLFDRRGPFELYSFTRETNANSLGSGFIVDSSGHILTNSHVVENASKITVKLRDGRVVDAVVVGTDPKTDLAVLKIKNPELPALRLAQYDDVAVGDWVAAFGSPFGLEETMTAGIISAKGRGLGSGSLGTFLQTDAAINPGNSGGPLVDMHGEVVGVNTTIGTHGRGFSGIGFAIPARTAQKVYERLVQAGKVTRGWIGARIQEITPEIARSFDLKNPDGALVADVAPDGPAAKAGMRSGDIILEFNHQQVQSAHSLLAAVANAKVGSAAHVLIWRSGRELSLDVPVGERPTAVAEVFRSREPDERGKLGITVENVSPEIQAEMHLASNRGVLVIEVTPGSSADDGGVLPGDVIHAINHSPVHNAAELLSAMGNLKQDGTVLLNVERHGRMIYLAFQLSS